MDWDEKQRRFLFRIADLCRCSVATHTLPLVAAECAYAFSRWLGGTQPGEFVDFVNRLSCSVALKARLIEDLAPVWKDVLPLAKDFTQNELERLIREFAQTSTVDRISTPATLIPLAVRLLSAEPGGLMLDLACGTGSVLSQSLHEDSELRAHGVDINSDRAIFSEMACAASVPRGEAICANAFDFLENRHAIYDKVYCHPPIGMRDNRFEQLVRLQKCLPEGFPEVGPGCPSELLFTLAAVAAMKDIGRAVVLLPSGVLSSRASAALAVRRHLLESGYLDCIVSLPPRIAEPTSIEYALLVLTARPGRRHVVMVDASRLGTKTRRFTMFSPEDVGLISDAVYGFGVGGAWCDENRVEISADEIRVSEYDLAPRRYFNSSALPSLENPTPFKDVLLSVERGANVGSRELDDLVAAEDGTCFYLSPGNIVGGRIAHELTGMKELPKGAVVCRDGDLILLRTGAPGKVAIFEDVFGKPVVPSANLFVCRIDPSKANAWYLKAFIESADGERTRDMISVGTAIKSISRKALEEALIPCPSLEKQDRIAEAYRAKLAEISDVEARLRALRGELGSIYDMFKEGC